MSEVWSNIQLTASTDIDYKILKMYAVKWFDDENQWPVEEYDDAKRSITLESALADENEVLDFSKVLNHQIRSLAAKVSGNSKLKDRLLNWNFRLSAETEHYNDGTVNEYTITRRDNHLYISEDGGKEKDVRYHMYAKKIYSFSGRSRKEPIESDELDAGRCLISEGQLDNLLDNRWPADSSFDATVEVLKTTDVNGALQCLRKNADSLKKAVATHDVYKKDADLVTANLFYDAIRVGCAHDRKVNTSETEFLKGAAEIFGVDVEKLIGIAEEEPDFKDLIMKKIKIGYSLPVSFNSIIGMIACCIYCDGLIEEKDKTYLDLVKPYLSGSEETPEEKKARLEKEKAERLEREKKEREALEKKRKAEEEARKKAEAEAKAKAEAEQKAWEEEAARIKATRKEELEKKLAAIEDDRNKQLETAAEEKNSSLSSCEDEIANTEKAGSDMEKELASLGFLSFGKKGELKKSIQANEEKKVSLASKKESILKKYDDQVKSINQKMDQASQNAKPEIEKRYPIPDSPVEKERKRKEAEEAEKRRKELEKAQKEVVNSLTATEDELYYVLDRCYREGGSPCTASEIASLAFGGYLDNHPRTSAAMSLIRKLDKVGLIETSTRKKDGQKVYSLKKRV